MLPLWLVKLYDVAFGFEDDVRDALRVGGDEDAVRSLYPSAIGLCLGKVFCFQAAVVRYRINQTFYLDDLLSEPLVDVPEGDAVLCYRIDSFGREGSYRGAEEVLSDEDFHWASFSLCRCKV